MKPRILHDLLYTMLIGLNLLLQLTRVMGLNGIFNGGFHRHLR